MAGLAPPGAVLFDLDGTLVDTVEHRIHGWLDALEAGGLPSTRDRIAPLIGIDGRRLAREIAAQAGRSLDDPTVEELDRDAGERFERLNTAPRQLPGVRVLVDALDARGIPWAIATSSRREQVASSVAVLDLPREPRITDASHVVNAKPAPDLMLRAAEELGIDPAFCWYVGDSTWDMVAAVAAGMVGIAVRAGSAVSDEALRGAGAAAVVDDLAGLAAALP